MSLAIGDDGNSDYSPRTCAMEDKTRAALTDQATWLRLPVMLLFFLMLVVATPLLIVVSAVGWLIRLFTGEQPEGVVEFGQAIGKWFRRCTDYLCGAAERRPFPFEDHDCPSDRVVAEPRGARRPQPGDAGNQSASASSGTAGGTSAAAPGEAVPGPSLEDENPVEKAVASRKTSKKKAGPKKSTRKKAVKKKSSRKKTSGGGKTAARKKTDPGSTSDAGSAE
jgi:hypothetical protein